MFNNIGRTIKIFAKILFWFGTITIIGIVAIWPTAFLIYGFGELIERTQEIAKNTGKNAPKQEMRKPATKNTKTAEDKDIEALPIDNSYFDPENIAKENECPMCFHKITPADKECAYCGYKLK